MQAEHEEAMRVDFEEYLHLVWWIGQQRHPSGHESLEISAVTWRSSEIFHRWSLGRYFMEWDSLVHAYLEWDYEPDAMMEDDQNPLFADEVYSRSLAQAREMAAEWWRRFGTHHRCDRDQAYPDQGR